MSGLDTKRLVLVCNTYKSSAGEEKYKYGTGYFVTKELILTAGHVVSPTPTKVDVRLEESSGRESPWLKAETVPIWIDQKLDAALIKVIEPIQDEVELPSWGETGFENDVEWRSVAYPQAASQRTEEGLQYKSSGLMGTLYAYGGGGQGLKELELGVEHESEEKWTGISGAPIFVGDKLIGIIKSYKSGYSGKRLDGVPMNQLRIDPTFQRTLKPKWLTPLPQQLWTLLLISENSKEGFSKKVKSSIEKQQKAINEAAGLKTNPKPGFVEILVTDALEDPVRWYELVEAICAAPVMVVDVTKYQPAIMLLLGIRAVVRRGVTITMTSDVLDESLLSELPFNIQETKLIYGTHGLGVDSPRHPNNRIGNAIVKGLKQLQENSRYLDLPAYEAVRCPEPQATSTESPEQAKDIETDESVEQKNELERILVLCSFNKEYQDHWLHISEKITDTFTGSLERMLDISSPRLVGQALYESIRWTRCCIIDWTHWRPNVFFELGVRLACSDIGPICLIEEKERTAEGEIGLKQKAQLVKLLQPISYTLNGPLRPFEDAFKRYDYFRKHKQENFTPDSTIPHDATYRTVVNAYDWKQEAIAKLPHEELRRSVEAQQNTDPQTNANFQALFSSNREFKNEIQRIGRERWIAAWYYFKNRYAPEELKTNEKLRAQLDALTERVMQELKPPDDPNYQSDSNYQIILDEAVELSSELELPPKFSYNFDFACQLRRNKPERWIAAWYYFRNRHVEELISDEEFRQQLRALTERVVEELQKQTETDSNYQRIHQEALELLKRLGKL